MEARVDFGEYGILQTSAQVVDLYDAQALVGRRIVGVPKFPPKRIGPFVSEFVQTGFHTPQGLVITMVERAGPVGARLA